MKHIIQTTSPFKWRKWDEMGVFVSRNVDQRSGTKTLLQSLSRNKKDITIIIFNCLTKYRSLIVEPRDDMDLLTKGLGYMLKNRAQYHSNSQRFFTYGPIYRSRFPMPIRPGKTRTQTSFQTKNRRHICTILCRKSAENDWLSFV